MSEETSQNNPMHKRIRKKRKNFVSNAKKYVKKGQMGRGTKMPEELYRYFVGILDVIKQGMENEDERHVLVNNVLERTKGEELNIIGNQLGCRVIELLLPYSLPEDLERFMEVLLPDLRILCSDNFSSHVIETVVRVACQRATDHLQDLSEDGPQKKKAKKENKYTDKHIQKCHEYTIKISKYALNNFEYFISDNYANHILRCVLKCLSGIMLLPGEKPKINLFKETVGQSKGIPPHTTEMVYRNIPDDFREIVVEYVNRLMTWHQFEDLPYSKLSSGFLQIMLYAIKNIDKKLTKAILKRLLDESFAPDNWETNEQDEKKDKVDIDNPEQDVQGLSLPPVFSSESAVRLLEAALFVADKKLYTQIYAKCFINRLGQLATLPTLNFTAQRLIDNCNVKEEFEPMFDELADRFGALLACGNTGVIVALAKGCLRNKAKQTLFLTCLETALKCSEPDNQKYLSVLCLRLLPLDRVDLAKLDKDYFINVHGSVILQTVLDFQRPAKAVNSLLELTPEQLMVILCDAKGCHVADALCKGQFVGVKARDKLIWRVKGYYQRLALSQYGSRAFEKIFEVASPEQKVKIMTEISEKSNLLNSTAYGRLIATKLDVETFKVSQKKWEQMWKKKQGE
ncbi:nucleolar protein 9 [Manduca sexta]|uniref:nucleolar protein 9 n=1 Tax=Manduca sexta TaxID=7130 RepID=UPI00188E0E1B|nr:nucleolar protein 9 [Manduca sexta]